MASPKKEGRKEEVPTHSQPRFSLLQLNPEKGGGGEEERESGRAKLHLTPRALKSREGEQKDGKKKESSSLAGCLLGRLFGSGEEEGGRRRERSHSA